jgi:CrcB protein
MPLSRPADGHPELALDPDAPDERADAPLHLRVSAVGLVAVGGFFGTGARYGLTLVEAARSGGWPWATFIANMVGAFVLGALLERLARGGPDTGWRQRLRLLLGTGFCGALTTYSTLATEADLLVRSRDGWLALAYLTATLIGGLVATVSGVAAATGQHRYRRRGQRA